MRREPRGVLPCLLALSLGACDQAAAPEDDDFNLGILVHAGSQFAVGSSPDWLTPDRELAFRAADGTGVKRLDVVTGELETLDGLGGEIFGWSSAPTRELVARPDGSALYYLHYDSTLPADVLRGMSLPDRGVTTLATGPVSGLSLRADGLALAYDRSGDVQLVVLDLATMQDEIIGQGIPLSFSPDGSELLLMGDTDAWRMDLGTSAVQEVTSWTSIARAPLAAHWDSEALRLLMRDGSVVEVLDTSDGAVVQLFVGLPGEEPRPKAVWSDRGDRVAFWTERCLGSGPFGGCSLRRLTVYVADPVGGTTTPLASLAEHDPTSTLLFSSDGRRLYYGLSGSLYVADVP